MDAVALSVEAERVDLPDGRVAVVGLVRFGEDYVAPFAVTEDERV